MRYQRTVALVTLAVILCVFASQPGAAFPTTLQQNKAPRGTGRDTDTKARGQAEVPSNSSSLGSTVAGQTRPAALKNGESTENHVSMPSIEELPEAPRLDYYDYLQLPRDPDEDMPVLPDQAVNVNEDYAGIYDYRGSQDGRFRRKRTLTTNIEQLLTRGSRVRRMKRGVDDNTLDPAPSPGEQAENLVTLLTAMQEADPDFDANEFLKVLDTPQVSEQDLEYLLYLSNLATVGQRARAQKLSEAPFSPQAAQPFYLTPDFVLPDDKEFADSDRSRNGRHPKEPSSKEKDYSRLFAVAALLAQQDEKSAAIAM